MMLVYLDEENTYGDVEFTPSEKIWLRNNWGPVEVSFEKLTEDVFRFGVHDLRLMPGIGVEIVCYPDYLFERIKTYKNKHVYRIEDYTLRYPNDDDSKNTMDDEKPEILCSGSDNLNDCSDCPLKCHGSAPVEEKEGLKSYEFYKSNSLDVPHKVIIKNTATFLYSYGREFVKAVSSELATRSDDLMGESKYYITDILQTINSLPNDDDIEVMYNFARTYQSWNNNSIYVGFAGKNSGEIKLVFEDAKPSIILNDSGLEFDWNGAFRAFKLIETRTVSTNKSDIDKRFTKYNHLDGIHSLNFLRDILSPERYQEIHDFCNVKSVHDFIKRDIFSYPFFDKINEINYLKIDDIFYNKEKCHHFTYFLSENTPNSKNAYEDSKYSLYKNTYYDRLYDVTSVCHVDKFK